MIKTLEELINSDAMENEYDGKEHVFDARDIPLDDPDVMSLFANTSALGITPEDIDGCPVGCLGSRNLGRILLFRWWWIRSRRRFQTDPDFRMSHGTDCVVNNAQYIFKFWRGKRRSLRHLYP